MYDFEREDTGESRLKAYQRKIKERKMMNSSFEQNNAYNVDPESEISSFDSNESNTELMIKVDEKIEAICTIDKEYQDTLAIKKQAEDRAQRALASANEAAGKSAGFGKKKKAIIALQQATKEQAYANETNTKAIDKIALLLERITEATKALFSLCVSSVAANRSVYRQLELKLKGASEQELSDFARNEVLAVMQQLNDQQDIMAKQKKLSDEVHFQKDQLNQQSVQLETHYKIIEELKLQIKQQKEQFENELNKLKNIIVSTGEEQNKVEVSSSDESKNTSSEKTETEEKKKWWKRLFHRKH